MSHFGFDLQKKKPKRQKKTPNPSKFLTYLKTFSTIIHITGEKSQKGGFTCKRPHGH